MRGLEREFRKRGPWVTGFLIEGERLGGDYFAQEDVRLEQFLKLFPKPGRVLELGCLEGGHTFPIARRAEHVVAVDSRRENIEKARWIQQTLKLSNISFRESNLEQSGASELGEFDTIFNVGLLYHLPEPRRLLEELARIGDQMFLWTHVAPSEQADVQQGGYQGMLYEEHGPSDPLSGMSSGSFWPTLEELIRMLADSGFYNSELIQEALDHPHGPAVTIRTMSKTRMKAKG